MLLMGYITGTCTVITWCNIASHYKIVYCYTLPVIHNVFFVIAGALNENSLGTETSKGQK